MLSRRWSWIAAAAMALAPLTLTADEFAERGKIVFEQYRQSVITVQLVVKNRFSAPVMGSQEDESISEAMGAVVDPTGLTVLSISATDQSSILQSMFANMDEQFKFESNLGDIKMILDDGAELPARVVLRDKDLDLLFVQPESPPAQPLPSIDLGQGTAVQLLEPLVALARLGKVANRAAAVGLERIQAIIQKPRTLYVPGNDPTFSSLGSPVFTMDGKIVGVIAMRTIKAESAKTGMEDNMLPVVVPAADVLEAAKQALAAPAPAEKPEETPKSSEAPPAPAPNETVTPPAAPADPSAAPAQT